MHPKTPDSTYPPLPDAQAAGFKTVFAAELKRILWWRKNRNAADPADAARDVDAQGPFTAADQMGLIGVCLSGGGIRSATFNLGVLQTLARLKILQYVDYLSTVSGGGYIGAWLNAMIQRTGSMEDVQNGLDPNCVKTDAAPQKAIAHLRAFSNYLTPKVSALSADTWTLWTIWSRNTLLNLVILVTGVAALAAAVREAGLLPGWLNTAEPAVWVYVASAVLLLWTAVFLGWNLSDKGLKGKRNDTWVQLLVLCPAMAASVLITWLIRNGGITETIPIPVLGFGLSDIVVLGVVFSVLFGLFEWVADFRGCFLSQHDNDGAPVLAVLLFIGTALASGFATAAMFHGLRILLNREMWPGSGWYFLTFGPPAVITVLTLGVIVTIGLMGRDIPDEKREWSARLGAWAAIYTVGWLLVFGAVVYGPGLLKAAGAWAKATVTGAWIAASLGSILAGKSPKTNGSGNPSSSGINVMNLVAVVGPWAFMAGFFVAISLGVHELAKGTVTTNSSAPPAAEAQPANTLRSTANGLTVTVTLVSKSGSEEKFNFKSVWDAYWKEMELQDAWEPFEKWPDGEWHHGLGDILLLAAGVCLIASWRVDINEFSLHHFYKNRLVRCYLAASREKSARHPNPFTKFDPADDVRLNKLDHAKYSGPFPIVNATLNLSSGRNLAWQERKGAPFIFTPVYSGYDSGSGDSGTSVSRQVRVGEVSGNAYWPTRLVSKSEDGGIMLGTAAAISGAAANPNQGYHSSTAVAFLMTVFNVRLGWWLGNPARPDSADWTGPTFGLPYTVMELFGSTDASNAFVNLSDGGHFDNMGLYELVRRRCKYIVVCDAEQDGALNFGGMATAIRMCRTDFGAEIELSPDNIRKKAEGFSGVHCAIGKIKYRGSPAGKDGAGCEGILIYLKSSLTGDEPADVIGYHRESAEFPHETTADQWFTEGQFESYRRLGEHIASVVFGARAVTPLTSATGKAEFFESIEPA